MLEILRIGHESLRCSINQFSSIAISAHVGVPRGPGVTGAQQGQKHIGLHIRGLLGAADLPGEYRYRGRHRELIVAVGDRLNDLPLGIAGQTVGEYQ